MVAAKLLLMILSDIFFCRKVYRKFANCFADAKQGCITVASEKHRASVRFLF